MMPCFGKHHGGRKEDETLDAVRIQCGCENRERAADARSDERRAIRGDRAKLLVKRVEHPRHCECGEIRLIEIRTAKRHCLLGQALRCPDFNQPDFATLTMTRMLDRAKLIGSSLGGA